MPDTLIDAQEREAIIAAYRKRIADWQPLDLHPYGCLSILAALLLFGVSGPLIAHFGTYLPGWSSTALLVISVLAGVIGFFMMQSRVVRESPEGRSEQAIVALGGMALDAVARRDEAVALLFHAYDFRGPTVRSTFDFDAARARLGTQLEYVLAVEQVLHDAKLMTYPVFVKLPAA